MKTPKRTHCDIYKCDKCGGYGITYKADDATCALYQCSLCGAQWHMPFLPKRTLAIRTRWKRKNREARLRHALRVMKWRTEMQKSAAEGSERAREMVKRLLQGEMKLAAQYRDTIRTSGIYGQDIEGS